MFGKKQVCDCCGLKLNVNPIQISDGGICMLCNNICNASPLITVEKVKAAWDENSRRLQKFKPNMTESNLGCGYIFIDTTNKMACISGQKKLDTNSIVFKFSELEEYQIERVGEKTVTKIKGGITRAIIGGATFGLAGAIVGASTAKQETVKKGGVPTLHYSLNIKGIKTTVTLSNPPSRTANLLDSIMDEQ